MSQAGINNTSGGPSPPAVATSFVTDAGTAVPAVNILNVLGGVGISTVGAGNTVTINADTTLPYTEIDFADSPYTVLATDAFISVDTSGGAITVLLPNTTTTGREVVVKDRTGNGITNNITITTVGGLVNIDGAVTYVLDDDYDSVDILFGSSVYQTF